MKRPPTPVLKLKEKEQDHRLINYAGNISENLLFMGNCPPKYFQLKVFFYDIKTCKTLIRR